MKKRIELIIILAIMVIIVMLGMWHVISTSLLNPSFSKVDVSPLQNITYNNNIYGFSFTYPYDYLLNEADSTDNPKLYKATLIRREDGMPITNGEGPRSINVDIYKATSSISDWLKTPASNFHLGNQAYATTSINNLPAVRYKWDGLYQGETVAFEYLGNIITFSVTFDSSNDQIKKDFEEIISSLKLSDRLPTREEAVKLLQDKFADLKKYPSNNLPPTSIHAESDRDGWNVVFETNGSGVAYLLGAKCYQVKNNKEIVLKGEYKFDSTVPYKPMDVDGKNCQPIYQNVADYVISHIAELSSKKEVLGGKFYVTSLELTAGEGEVSYEDGHDAYKAHFFWTMGSDGRVAVTSFVIDK